MIRKNIVCMVVAIPLLTMLLILAIDTSSAMSVTPGIYHVYGRVLNQLERPVENCNVMLVKSRPGPEEKTTGEEQKEQEETVLQPDEITSQEIVAITKTDGEFSFIFEPLAGDNFWLYFVADGYRTRTMQMNKQMRSRFFQKPNKSPLHINVVLEKE